MDLGEGALKPRSYPKVAFSMSPRDQPSDASNVVVRLGYFAGADNRVELIYDPTNHLGGHDSANWWFELVSGGSVRARTDMGIGPAEDQSFAFNRESSEHWSVAVERKNLERGSNGGTNVGKGTWRWYVETLGSDDKKWNMLDYLGMRFYRF
jgi:hypothetical protein